MVTWYWSADNLIWQVSIDHNMMSYINKVHGKQGQHVSINLLFEVWPPCCATPPSSLSSCVGTHEKYHWPQQHEKINSWVSFISLYGYGALLGGPKGRWSSAITQWQSQDKFWAIHSGQFPLTIVLRYNWVSLLHWTTDSILWNTPEQNMQDDGPHKNAL